MTQLWQHADANLALIQSEKKDEAFAHLVDKTIPARNQVLEVQDEMVSYRRSELTSDVEGGHKPRLPTVFVCRQRSQRLMHVNSITIALSRQ